jgi:NodT family efflux transporter outer membrane factor (OMF) lipoprotein
MKTKTALILMPALAALAACKVGPDYMRPATPMAPIYKENAGWTPASPAQAAGWETWWAIYNDPVLDALEKDVDISNQNLKAAEAAYRAARAEVGVQRAALFPALDAGAGARLSGSGASKTTPGLTASLSGNWDIDLWGRIRRTVEGSVANAQASAADIAAARLSAQSELAGDYFTLRAADEQAKILQESVEDFQMALDIARNRYNAGIATAADVYAAQTQVDNAEAQLVNVRLTRARMEHAIAALTGKPPSELSVVLAPNATTVPVVPADIPSTLLQRRPDIAAAEYAIAAANAQIGVAISAWFPDITLSGVLSTAATGFGGVFNASNLAWSVGPQLAETVFSGGARVAQTEEARARYDQSVALYRQTVLTAFQQVEDDLATLRILEEEAAVNARTVADARQAEQLALNQYRAGTADFTTVIQAQTARFNAETVALNVLNERLTGSTNLVVALGGGWDMSRVPQPGGLYSLPRVRESDGAATQAMDR